MLTTIPCLTFKWKKRAIKVKPRKLKKPLTPHLGEILYYKKKKIWFHHFLLTHSSTWTTTLSSLL